MNKIFIIIKPDAVKRNITQRILPMFNVNFKLHRFLFKQLTVEEARELYSVHSEQPFYEDLVAFMVNGKSFIATMMTNKVNAEDAVKLARDIVTEVRQQYGTSVRENCIHASDSVQAVEKESAIFFK